MAGTFGAAGAEQAGYDAIFFGSQGRIVEVVCWAHARRKFIDAQRADRARTETARARIGRLYGIEKELRARCENVWRELPRAERHQRVLAERLSRAVRAAAIRRVA